ncbi:hypothetical protein BGX24_006459 [Mortierella sp. AD032]|nr:hypothetical protein BGX24_006459 [Mortierella sp. AD032]
MKISVALIVAALASSTQALKLGYVSSMYSNNLGFKGTMYIDGRFAAGVTSEGASSAWVPRGIHKIQLSNAYMTSFDFCIDVFGNVSCTHVTTHSPTCAFNPQTQRPECRVEWNDDNWGGASA